LMNQSFFITNHGVDKSMLLHQQNAVTEFFILTIISIGQLYAHTHYSSE